MATNKPKKVRSDAEKAVAVAAQEAVDSIDRLVAALHKANRSEDAARINRINEELILPEVS